jgi:hypothetical protein
LLRKECEDTIGEAYHGRPPILAADAGADLGACRTTSGRPTIWPFSPEVEQPSIGGLRSGRPFLLRSAPYRGLQTGYRLSNEALNEKAFLDD